MPRRPIHLCLASALAFLAACDDDAPPPTSSASTATTPAPSAPPTSGAPSSPASDPTAVAMGKEIEATGALQQGRFQDALALYDELVALEPDKLQHRVNRAVALSNLGRNEEALALTEECLIEAPQDPEILINRAVMLGALGRSEEALAAIDVAEAAGGERFKVLFFRLQTLFKLGRIDEAIALHAAFDPAVRNTPQAVLEWARMLDGAGRAADAEPFWQALLQQFPNDPQLRQVYDSRPAAGR